MKMIFYPKDSMIIGRMQNGWVLRVKGSREEQEDNLDGIYAFRSVKELCDWLTEKYPDSKIITHGSCPGPLFPSIDKLKEKAHSGFKVVPPDKRPWCPACKRYPGMTRISMIGPPKCPDCGCPVEYHGMEDD